MFSLPAHDEKGIRISPFVRANKDHGRHGVSALYFSFKENSMLAVVDYRIPEQAKHALEHMGHRVLALPPHPSLPAPINAHPDMLLFFASDSIFCTKAYQNIANHGN